MNSVNNFQEQLIYKLLIIIIVQLYIPREVRADTY